MPDAVTKIVMLDSPTLHGIHITGISDGTGEAAAIKVDKSAISVASDGAEAASLDLVSARWTIVGYTHIKILWDHNTDDVAMILAGTGFEDFSARGQKRKLADPRTTNTPAGTGDVVLTTVGHDSGDTYDITLWFEKAQD